MRVGGHLPFSSDFVSLLKTAERFRFSALSMFVNAPLRPFRAVVSEERQELWRRALDTHRLSPKDMVVHATYTMNLASPNERKQSRSIALAGRLCAASSKEL